MMLSPNYNSTSTMNRNMTQEERENGDHVTQLVDSQFGLSGDGRYSLHPAPGGSVAVCEVHTGTVIRLASARLPRLSPLCIATAARAPHAGDAGPSWASRRESSTDSSPPTSPGEAGSPPPFRPDEEEEARCHEWDGVGLASTLSSQSGEGFAAAGSDGGEGGLGEEEFRGNEFNVAVWNPAVRGDGVRWCEWAEGDLEGRYARLRETETFRCVRLCACVHVCVCLRACTQAYVYACTYVCRACIRMYVNVCEFTNTCVRTYMHTCIHAYILAYMHAHVPPALHQQCIHAHVQDLGVGQRQAAAAGVC